MRFTSLKSLLESEFLGSARGPIALIFAEDEVEIDTTLRHHLQSGFRNTLAFMPASFEMAADLEEPVIRIDHDAALQDSFDAVVTQVNAAVQPDTWIYYCFNAEYLFYPFCEHRTVGEMLSFHKEERRSAMLTYVVDLYAQDLHRFPDAVSLDEAHIDRTGYYALARPDLAQHNYPKERQLDFFGGLRWRFEEHVPPERRKIDRIALFQSAPGLILRPDHTFSVEEYNTYACPWHHNLTASIASFRTAKALKSNPGSKYDIETFHWHNSVPFEWHSRQLLDLGLMEPGQWF
ncbi:hypothetical protein ACS3SW_17900 [Roseobacteraceae bacterium S113]